MKKTTLLLLLLSFFGLQSAHAEEVTSLSFGIVPQQAAGKLARLWGPILAYLGEKTDMKLQFKTAPDIPEFERRCAMGEYDIAYMNPYHYTVFEQAPGYRAFARQRDKRIRGILVVRKDNPIQELSALAGSNLAFPAPAAFAASVLTRAELANRGIAFTPKYVSSHDSVYRTVAKGLYSAGGGIQRTFNNVAPEVRDQLRILWTSAPFTPHAIAAHPRVAEDILERLRRAMLEMDQDPKGKELLSRIKFKGIEPATNDNWDDVRSLGLDLLEQLIRG